VVAPSSGTQHMVGMRRVGETEGVRQSLGNMQVATPVNLATVIRRVVVPPLEQAELRWVSSSDVNCSFKVLFEVENV